MWFERKKSESGNSTPSAALFFQNFHSFAVCNVDIHSCDSCDHGFVVHFQSKIAGQIFVFSFNDMAVSPRRPTRLSAK